MTNNINQIRQLLKEYDELNDKYFDLNIEYTDKEEDEMTDKLAVLKFRIVDLLQTFGIDEKTAVIMVDNPTYRELLTKIVEKVN